MKKVITKHDGRAVKAFRLVAWLALTGCVAFLLWRWAAPHPAPATPAHVGCYVAARGAWILPGEYVSHTGHGSFGWTGSVCTGGKLVPGVYGGEPSDWPKSSGISGVNG